MKHIINRIYSLFKQNIFTAIVVGLIGGALAGSIEAIIKSMSFDYPSVPLITLSLYYYGMAGALISIIYLISLSAIMGLVSHQNRIKKGLDYTLFAASASYLEAMLILNLLLRQWFKLPLFSPAYIIVFSLSTFLFFLFCVLCMFLLKRTATILKLRFRTFAILIYFLSLLIFTPITLLYHLQGNKISPYNTKLSSKISDKPYVILIIEDALRQDWLSCYEYDINTPNFQKLADDGITFTNAFSQCSWTKPSIASIFTSLYPSEHKVVDYYTKINPNIETLASVLGDIGYYTIGLHNNVLITKTGNFQLGFNYYRYLIPPPIYPYLAGAPSLNVFTMVDKVIRALSPKSKIKDFFYEDGVETSKIALNWISKNRDKKFFMFLHYMEPHEPYFTYPYTGDFVSIPNNYNDKILKKCSDAYKGEIRYADKSLGVLFDYLKEEGIYDSTLIVLTADHGEAFYDHKNWGHGQSLYDELIHIPLIIKLPFSQRKGSIDSSLAQNIDIAPTIINYIGGKTPDNWEGRDLFSQKKIKWSIAELTYNGLYWYSMHSIKDKLYMAMKDDNSIAFLQYYNIANDPGETINLAQDAEYSGEISRLVKELINKEKYFSGRSANPLRVKLDEKTLKRLKELGYIN